MSARAGIKAVRPGAGLSSSAAIELSSALAFAEAAGERPSREVLVKAARHAENNFVGVPCGVLDQGVSGFGKKDHLVFIDQVVGSQRLRTASAVGETFPLYCTANGKAYLAQLSDAGVEALIGRVYESRTPKTLTRLDALLAELKAVRRNGVAFDREEHTLGICAAGVALQDPLGNSVAISVPVPTQRFQNRQALIAERLLATKHALETHMSSAAA